jgi:hypothetical protein
LIVASLVGAAIAVILGVYDRGHDGTAKTFPLFFSGQLQMKTWFATLAVLFALFQVLSALRIYGKVKIPKQPPKWLGDAHRLSGTLAFLFSLPVAYHCLWSIGSRDLGSTRVVVHAIAGSLFYGVFATKMLIVRDRKTPGWALPLVGGLAFTALVVIWFSSAYWFLTTTKGSIF